MRIEDDKAATDLGDLAANALAEAGDFNRLAAVVARFSDRAADDEPADELANLLDADGLVEGAKLPRDSTNRKRVGRIAGTALGNDAEAFQDGAVAIGKKLRNKPSLHTHYVVGAVTKFNAADDLDNPLLRHFGLSETDVKALCEAGHREVAAPGPTWFSPGVSRPLCSCGADRRAYFTGTSIPGAAGLAEPIRVCPWFRTRAPF